LALGPGLSKDAFATRSLPSRGPPLGQSDTLAPGELLIQSKFLGTPSAHMLVMRARALLCLALVSATGALAASSGFLLGVDYSEWLTPDVTQIATDGSGALYVLSQCATVAPFSSCVTKLSADGKTILWQTIWVLVDSASNLPGMAWTPGRRYVIPSGRLAIHRIMAS